MLDKKIKYQKVKKKYEKDRHYEEMMSLLNESLSSVQDQLYKVIEDEKYSNIHIIGVPRSGTTLLFQLLISSFDFAFINNIIALFWKAPMFGINISRKLLGDFRYSSDYSSDYGRTPELSGPHEYNYFWYDMLGYNNLTEPEPEFDDVIDWNRVQKVIRNIVSEFGKPVLFKSFLLGWHASRYHSVLPRSGFIFIRRDPIDTAISILNMRKKYLGHVNRWVSFKPREYQKLRCEPYWKQVAGQVYYLEKAYMKQLSELDKNEYRIITYEDLCKEPESVLDNLGQFFKQKGVQRKNNIIDLKRIKPISYKDHEDYNKIKKAFEDFG